MKEKYLFFYFKTWWWHISAAKAIERYFGKKYNETTEVLLVDGFEEANPLIKTFIEWGYANAQSYAQWAYEFFYLLNKTYLIAKFNQFALSYFTKPYIKKVITRELPSKIVIFHFFLVKPVLAALQELWLNIPVVTVVTDPFTATRTWFLEKNMHYIVYSERIKSYAIRLWVDGKNIEICPPIIHEKFTTPLSHEQKNEVKQSLDLPLNKRIILLLWSWDWFPKGKAILTHMSKQRLDVQIIIVCGRNKSLASQVQRIKDKYPHLLIQIHGFVDNVDALINISDIVLTKGWPAAIFEILLCNKIPVINTYMWEQEKWNVEFVVQNGMGIYESNTPKLVQKITEMLDTDLSEYHTNREKIQLKIGTEQIAEHIKSFQMTVPKS